MPAVASFESDYGMRAEELAQQQRLRLQGLFPDGGFADVAETPAVVPGPADASIQTIGTIGVSAGAQTSYGHPFSVESDRRFPLEGLKNTGS